MIRYVMAESRKDAAAWVECGHGSGTASQSKHVECTGYCLYRVTDHSAPREAEAAQAEAEERMSEAPKFVDKEHPMSGVLAELVDMAFHLKSRAQFDEVKVVATVHGALQRHIVTVEAERDQLRARVAELTAENSAFSLQIDSLLGNDVRVAELEREQGEILSDRNDILIQVQERTRQRDALAAALELSRCTCRSVVKTTCPQCGKPLKPVLHRGGALNEYQFMAVRAGDFYCDSCSGSEAKTGWKYWWIKDLESVKETCKRCAALALLKEPAQSALRSVSPFEGVAARNLALAVHKLVESGKLDSRSEAADALLNYCSTKYGDSNPIGSLLKEPGE